MSYNLNIFKREFLKANTWEQRREGVPLNLLDNLTTDELEIAETELIKSANLEDTWPIIGLGHIQSKKALPVLYSLLAKSSKGMKITIAHSIFQICQDTTMTEIVLEEVPKTTNQYELISILHLLPTFQDRRVIALVHAFRNHHEYLVAYNATVALGLPTDDVVKKFSHKSENKNFWRKLFG